MSELKEPSDNDGIDCHLQVIGMGGLICRGAKQEGDRNLTNEVNRKICYNCDVGKIYREVGCDSVLPKIYIYNFGREHSTRLDNLFCKILKKDITLDYCKTCEIANAETTRQIVTTTRGLFEAQGFYSAYKNLENARNDIKDGNFESSITQSIACLESVMRICHDKMGAKLPGKPQLAQLWTSTKELLSMDKMDNIGASAELMTNINGVVISLGKMRNSFGDAHGKGIYPPDVSASMAELSINTSSTLSTVIIRRLNQVQGGKK